MLVTDTHCSLPLHEPLTFVHSEFQAVAEAKLPAQSFLLITPPLGYREELGCLWLLRGVHALPWVLHVIDIQFYLEREP